MRCPTTAPAPIKPEIAPDAPAEVIGCTQFHASDAADPPSPHNRYSATNRARPKCGSSTTPTWYSATMFIPRCAGVMCMKTAVTTRHHSPSRTSGA